VTPVAGGTGSRALERDLAELLRAAGRAAHALATAPSAAEALPQALRALALAAHADRALLMPVESRGPSPRDWTWGIAHEWVQAGSGATRLMDTFGASPRPFVGRGYDFTRRLELLRGGKPVVYASVRALPENETALAQQVGTRSSVRIPVHVGGELCAMLGLDHTAAPWPWRADELEVLMVVGALIGEAMMAFTGRELPLGTGEAAVHPVVAFWSRTALRLFGADPGAALEAMLPELGEVLGLRRAGLWRTARPGALALAFSWSAPQAPPVPPAFDPRGIPGAGAPEATAAVAIAGAGGEALGWLGVEAPAAPALRAPLAAGLLDSLADVLGAAIALERRRRASGR
jgi:hypothetical protein